MVSHGGVDSGEPCVLGWTVVSHGCWAGQWQVMGVEGGQW